MRSRHYFALIGAFLGLVLPFGWLIWRAYSTRRSWWLSWLTSEFHRHYPIYICLALAGIAGCVVFGYLVGLRDDRRSEESETVRDWNAELSQQASTDPLTGLFNARAIHERLDAELEDSFRASLSCLLIDIDHFKRINDAHGHPFGDTVLVSMGQVLREAVRRVDAVGRLGGEEFIIVLPRTNQFRALIVAERVRAAVQAQQIRSNEKPVRVTVSVGVATYPAPGLRGKNSLLKAADDALYRAKRTGRNRVILWNKEPDVSTDMGESRAA